jgi:hypothetical protein
MAETYIARSTMVAARMLGGETMVMSAIDSTFFTLDEVASVIWHAADGQTSLDRIVNERICPEFEVAPDVALHDAEEFVRELSQHGILLVSDQPMPEGGTKA